MEEYHERNLGSIMKTFERIEKDEQRMRRVARRGSKMDRNSDGLEVSGTGCNSANSGDFETSRLVAAAEVEMPNLEPWPFTTSASDYTLREH